MADDDYERLLREVEAALARPDPVPVRPAAGQPGPPADEPQKGAGVERPAKEGAVERVRAGLPWSLAVGAGCGVVAWTTFTVLPFVDGLSGGLAAFCTGFALTAAGRVRRRR